MKVASTKSKGKALLPLLINKEVTSAVLEKNKPEGTVELA